MSHYVLQVWRKSIEKEHVTYYVDKSSVHEHGGEDGNEIPKRVLVEACGNEGPHLNERVAASQFKEKHSHIYDHQ